MLRPRLAKIRMTLGSPASIHNESASVINFSTTRVYHEIRTGFKEKLAIADDK